MQEIPWPVVIEHQMNPEDLVLCGPLIPGGFAPTDTPTSAFAKAPETFLVLDTGSTHPAIDEDYAQKLGYQTSKERADYAMEGLAPRKLYDGLMWVPGKFSDGSAFVLRSQTSFGGVPRLTEGCQGIVSAVGSGTKYPIVGIWGLGILRYGKLEIDGRTGTIKVWLYEEWYKRNLELLGK